MALLASRAVDGPSDDFRHVTILGGGRLVELTLPAGAPVAEFAPALAALCMPAKGPTASEGTPPAWSLARPGAPALGLTTSLAGAGVRDGDVLHLVDVAVWQPAEAADLAGVLGAAVGLGPRWWGGAASILLAGAAVLAVLLAAAVAVGSGAVQGSAGVVALLVAAAALAASIAMRGRMPARVALAASAGVLAALGGWGVAGAAPAAGAVAAGALAAALAALVACAVAPVPGPGAVLALGTLAAGAAAVARGAAPDVVAAVAAVVGVAVLPLLPLAVSRAVAALPASGGATSMLAIVRLSRRLQVSLSCGAVATVLGAAAVLLWTGGPPAWAVAGLAAAALLAVACAHRLTLDVLPPALAAGLTAIALAAALSVRALLPAGSLAAAIALPAAAGLALILLAVVRIPPLPRALPLFEALLRDRRAQGSRT
jgi:hypothetical protein